MLIITKKEVEKIIPLGKIKKVIDAVEKAFFDYGQGKVNMPAKLYLIFNEFNGDLRIMPSYSDVLKLAGTKIVNVHPDNPKIGLKTVMAVVVLSEAKTGLPLAMMDGTYLTGMRTGAASAVATKYLARKDASTLGVIGGGYQSIFQIAAITKVRKIKEIFVYDLFEKQVEKLAKLLAKEKIKIKKGSLEETARQDILVTVTPARAPILKAGLVLPGAHINTVGADAPGKEELEPQVLKGAKIFVDNWEQASHSGEINVPLAKGIVSKNDIFAELGEVVVGKKPGRESEKEITIFDSTGLAIQDLYTGNLIYNLAKKGKIGKKIEIFS